MTASAPGSALHITFDAPQAALSATPAGAVLSLPVPVLAGQNFESLGRPGARARWQEDFLIAEDENSLFGATLIDATGRLEEPVERAYRTLLRLTRGWNLYRIWNYLPGINAERGGLECYRQFNIGRWAAFESCYGRDLRSFMPAASAVGLPGDQAVVIFKAGRSRAEYLENPSQIPAYHYPAEYGPRPPGFARGVVAARPPWRLALLSGTASIEGHRSVGEGDWARQFRVTQHNIETMLARMQVPAAWRPDLWASGGILHSRFKCYLRHQESLSLIREWVVESCGQDSHFTYVLADICRSDLDLEIEGYALSSPLPDPHAD